MKSKINISGWGFEDVERYTERMKELGMQCDIEREGKEVFLYIHK